MRPPKILWTTRTLCGVVGFLTALAGPRAFAAEPAAAPLPVTKVVLFHSGVGYFEHRGEVDGDAQVDLEFGQEDINDVLKSMVVQDFGGGRISTVTYAAKEPAERKLQALAVDLTGEPSLGELLQRIRGERVKIEGASPLQGVVVGVEARRELRGANQVATVERLNLLTEQGLRSVALAQVEGIKLEDPALEADLREALATLANSRRHDETTVQLQFRGQGQRPVRVGYVREWPVWKTTYRLVLDEGKPALLQGWAIVENPTETAWDNVRLTLVSGRPISFVMDLSEPLYVRRPVVAATPLDVVTPPIHESDLVRRAVGKWKKDQGRHGVRGSSTGKGLGGFGGGGGSFGGFGGATAKPAERFDPSQGVEAAADAGEVGELFRYEIDTPVTLARRRSAMLPIVERSLTVEKLCIYNPAVHAKHPLNGLRLENTTDLHLMQGPLTVFDAETYAGDARLGDLPPGEKRLVSYALDVETEVALEKGPETRSLASVRIDGGVLEAKHVRARDRTYRVANSGDKTKHFLIEYARDDAWKLVQPKTPAETTRTSYRFALEVEAGTSETLAIREERIVGETIAVLDLDGAKLEYYTSNAAVDPTVKDALRAVMQNRRDREKLAEQQKALANRIREIHGEQTRLRHNMAALEKDSSLYRRYVGKLDEQENRIEKIQRQLATLATAEVNLLDALEEYRAKNKPRSGTQQDTKNIFD